MKSQPRTLRFFHRVLALTMSIIGVLALANACSAGLPQGEQCAAFVDCVSARDSQRGTSTDVERFVEGGPCWGSEEGAEQCETSCLKGLAFLRDAYTDLPEECAQ